MGASNSFSQNQQLFNSFNRNEWKVIANRGLYQLWQNSQTNQICEAYNLHQVPDEKSLENYRFRHDNQNTSHFVSVKYLNILQNKTLCSTGQSFVLTQYIPVNLSDMKQLTLSQGYSLLRATYCGFNTIEAFHGPFSPQQEMIGVNLNGKPKVWLNKDHSKLFAQTLKKAKLWQKHQGQISQNVRKILEMIEQKLHGKQFPTEFRSYFYDNIVNFFQAYQYVEQYCQKKSITIPDRIEYLRHIEDEQITKIVTDYQRKHNLVDRNHTQSSSAAATKFIIANPIENGLNKLVIKEHQHYIHRQNRFSKVIFNHSNKQQIVPTLHRVSTVPNISTINNYMNQKGNQSSQAHYKVSQVRVLSPPAKIVINNNLVNQHTTPRHITDNYKFKSPARITEFQQPQRQILTKISESPSAKGLVTIAESKYCGQAVNLKGKSINTQTIIVHKPYEVNETKQPLQLQESIHEKILNTIKQQNSQQRPLQQNEQLNNYIKQFSQKEDNNEQNEEERENLTSEPDWEDIQNQGKQQHNDQRQQQQDELNSEQEEYHRQQIQEMEANSQAEEMENYVEEYQEKEQQREQELEQQEKQQEQKQELEQELEQENIEKQIEQQIEMSQQVQSQQQNFIETCQVKNDEESSVEEVDREQYQFNFSQNISNQNNHYYYEQNVRISQKQGQQNQQNYHQSSRTLIVHDSQENIYQEINRKDFTKKQTIETSIRDNKIIVSHNQIGEAENSNTEQAHTYNNNYQSKILQMKKLQIEIPSQTHDQTEPESLIAKYQGLHFRNESDELYQYRPTQSISNEQFISHIERNTSNNVNEITKLQSQKQIQDYIKNKYQHLFGYQQATKNRQIKQNKTIQMKQIKRSSRQQNQRTMTFAKQHDQNDYVKIPNYNHSKYTNSRPNSIKNDYKKQVQFMMGNIESQYYKPPQSTYTTMAIQNIYKIQSNNQIQSNESDFLDVKNLQKNLDSKYNNINKNNLKNKSSNVFSDQDGFNVAILDEKLQKFEQNRHNLQKSQVKAPQSKPIGQNFQNFSEFDNFVQMMDRKIQQSQSRAKIASSRSGTQNQFKSKFQIQKTSNQALNTINYPLNLIPNLIRDKSKEDSLEINGKIISVQNRYALDSGRNSNPTSNKGISSFKQNTLDKVFSFSKKTIDNVQQNIQPIQNNQNRKRVSKRLSAALDANKLADEIQKKYQKHINRVSNNTEIPSQERSFAKKKQSYTLDLSSQKQIMRNYTQSQAVDTEFKKSSRGQLGNPQEHYQSYKTLSSNKTSNQGSKKSLGLGNGKRNSKVSYEQLRDLLWN